MLGAGVALNCDIAIVGGGVLGLCVAVELTARGHDVVVLDPGGPNASSVAAGMIAPAMESVLEDLGPERGHLLRDAAALWPAFAIRTSIDLKPGPSAWRGDAPEPVAESLRAMGFAADIRDGAVWTGDQQVEPEPALDALRKRAGRVLDGRASALFLSGDRWTVVTSMGPVEASALVIATGAAEALQGLPCSARGLVERIIPIRGQIGWTRSAMVDGVTRGPGGYVAPMGEGTVIGATMGPGRRDLTVDVREAAALVAVAEQLTRQDLDARSVEWRVGIRGATADGLPMAGPSGEPGLHLALAPRRNGWLLGPLVGQIVADGIEGRPPTVQAEALDPRRFSRPAG